MEGFLALGQFKNVSQIVLLADEALLEEFVDWNAFADETSTLRQCE